MQTIFKQIERHAKANPEWIALADGRTELSYLQLNQEVERLAKELQGRPIGLLLANGCAWATLDLAAQRSGSVCVPMPGFFSDAQLRHLIEDVGPALIFTDQPVRLQRLTRVVQSTEIRVADTRLFCCVMQATEVRSLPAKVTKITYTSGTTGQPKGVCLTAEAVERVSISLSRTVGAAEVDRTLTLLPLSTLLANITGVYAPLYSGGIAYLPDLTDCGMSGSTGVQAELLIKALQRYQPTVTVLVPFLLKLLVEAVTQGARLPRSLRYIAVGGAPTAPALLQRARRLGLPIYQGYGLSEAASVVSMNVPGQEREGSVGRLLSHVGVRIAEDGEILVSGNLFSGYLGLETRPDGEWATGDTGYLDRDDYLFITGRKKTAYATAHGRKLAPEWIESELTAHPAIAQAALFGDGRSFNVAVLVPVHAAAIDAIEPAVQVLNQTLPDYARVSQWLITDEPFSSHNGLANGAGTIQRQAIAERYARQIEQLYAEDQNYAVL
ncbi:MAG: AMP-binding protein [Chromatiales bacterium]|jgi:long-subunit acyl-CoA synthetase (AMP-forming)